MSPKRSYEDRSRERILAFWEREESFGAPVGCVATTFTFDAAFFEEHCLARFVGAECNPQEDARGYLIEREEKLSQVFACVLADQSHVAAQRSLRWHLLPIRVPGGGVMHAKVSLLAWEHHVRVLVASANLTEPGYRRNFELAGTLDFTPESTIPLTLLEEIIGFIEQLRGLAPGAAAETSAGPQAALARFLSDLRRRVAAWDSAGWRAGDPRAVFAPVWPGGATLFDRVAEAFPSRTGPRFARIVSPFFDDGPAAKRVVDALLETMGVRGERELALAASGRVLPDDEGTVELDIPDVLREPWAARCSHVFERVHAEDDEGNVRPLHAKSLWLVRDDATVYVVGSSNFTVAGTGVANRSSNVEANLGYVIPETAMRFANCCERSWPPSTAVDLDAQPVLFRTTDRDSAGATEGQLPLPESFGLALFEPAGETGAVHLSMVGPPPKGFRVTGPSDEVLFDEATWNSRGQPTSITLEWTDPRPPSHLVVRWTDAAGLEQRAIWVVNVTDSAELPPPDELRTLALDELLEILTSARPLYEAVGALLRRRDETERLIREGRIVIDPHRRVDTRNFLLKRMRRVSAGLEGLRERLERPTFCLDGFRWRLHGPVGPVALARKLREQEPQAAAFMLAEVALTVHRADWSRPEAQLGRDAVRGEVRAVIAELHRLACGVEAPANLASYVDEAFAEVLR